MTWQIGVGNQHCKATTMNTIPAMLLVVDIICSNELLGLHMCRTTRWGKTPTTGVPTSCPAKLTGHFYPSTLPMICSRVLLHLMTIAIILTITLINILSHTPASIVVDVVVVVNMWCIEVAWSLQRLWQLQLNGHVTQALHCCVCFGPNTEPELSSSGEVHKGVASSSGRAAWVIASVQPEYWRRPALLLLLNLPALMQVCRISPLHNSQYCQHHSQQDSQQYG